MSVAADRGALAFAEQLLGLLGDGSFTATYKYAVILGLTDLCLEQSTRTGSAPTSVTTEQLAEKILELYWPHTLPFRADSVLKQNSGPRQATIVTRIERFRGSGRVDPTASRTRSQLADPNGYARLLRDVEWTLVLMPLPRLQRIGDGVHTFIYQIAWDEQITKRQWGASGFDNSIRFMPGAGDHLVRLSGLVRPLVQREWAALVARFNALAHAELEAFLFGPKRSTLVAVRGDLRELQAGRCFYCEGRMAGTPEVDHFIPWSRYPDDGLTNLVLAHARCNNAKRDHLASADHVARWVERARRDAGDLAAIAERRQWELHDIRTLGVGRSIYLRLPEEARLWHAVDDFVALDRRRLVEVFASRAA